VVDTKLRVKGVEDLRVVDASVITLSVTYKAVGALPYKAAGLNLEYSLIYMVQMDQKPQKPTQLVSTSLPRALAPIKIAPLQ
jgi:hypothetical protein